MFQLVYLDFTAPRLDTAAFEAFKNQVAPFLANRGARSGAGVRRHRERGRCRSTTSARGR